MTLSLPGLGPEKLERIQLPTPGAADNSYNHLLAERLIRIMNNAAQQGVAWWGWGGDWEDLSLVCPWGSC